MSDNTNSNISYIDIQSPYLISTLQADDYYVGSSSCQYLRNPEFYRRIREGWLGTDGGFLEYFLSNPPHLIRWGRKHILCGQEGYQTISIYLPEVNPIQEIWRTLNTGTYGYGTHWNSDNSHGVVKPYVWDDTGSAIGETYRDGTHVTQYDSRNLVVCPHTISMHGFSQPEGTVYNVTGLTAVYAAPTSQHSEWTIPVTPEAIFKGFMEKLGRSCGYVGTS